MFQKPTLRIIGIVAITTLVTFSAAAVAFGYVTSGFQPKGTMRVAAVSATNAINTTVTSFTDVPNLNTTVIVPDGKVADIVIEFSGVVNSPDALYVRAMVDSNVASPGPVQAFYGVGGGATTQGFNFYRFTVPAGSHRIAIQWDGLGGQQFMSYRSMVVFANIRNP